MNTELAGVLTSEPIAYRLTNYAYLKLLVADESVEVKRGKVRRIKIEPFGVPPSTISSTLSVIRHAYGIVLDVHGSTETEELTLNEASFLPIEDGFVEEGDLLGVIKVFILGKVPELRMVENQLSKRNIQIVYKTNGELRREKAKVSEMWYRRWHFAEWCPLIAEQDAMVTKGEPKLIEISSVEIPANAIPVPLFIMRNAYGVVLDLYLRGKPKKIEENRTVSKALFMPVFDGEIQKGDIIGILNIYNISVGERSKSIIKYLLKTQRGNLVFWKGERVLRKEFEIKPFQFKRSLMGRLEPLISTENKELKANEVDTIKIEKIEFPASTIVQPLTGKNHPGGVILDVFSKEPPRMVEDEKRVDQAVFLPYKDLEIKKGEVLGMVNVYHVTVLYEPETFVLKHGGLFPAKL
jgi:hypothetical protein